MVSSPAGAQLQAKPTELRAAVADFPPFVMRQHGTLRGFNIDLWNAVAARLNIRTNYQVKPGAASLMEAMRSKQADIVIAPVVITAARDQEFDFSVPIMQTGLRIMVLGRAGAGAPSPVRDLLELLFSKTTAVWLGIALLLVLIPAHLIWLVERNPDGIIADRRYFPGIFEAMYWALSCLATQAEAMPHRWIGRVFSVFWMFAGVLFVAFYTAQLTTTLTIRQIHGAINGPEDLPEKRVATIANTTAADYLRGRHARVQEYTEANQMFAALLNSDVDAVVFGTPMLRYYAAHQGNGLVRMVGPEFNVAPIAFAFQNGSPLRKKVSVALLTLQEDGTYQQLYNKWFGSP